MPKQPEPNPPETSAEPPAEDSGDLLVTVQEREYIISAAARDDFELLDDLSELDRRRDVIKMPSILRRLLGPIQMQAALDSIRDPETGRVTVDAGSAFVNDLLDALDPN